MTTAIRSEASRSVIVVNGADKLAINDDGSMELLTPNSNLADNAVVTRSTNGPIVMASKTATGTAVDFTGIPGWVNKITVSFQGVSTSGTSSPIVQAIVGTPVTTGYLGGSATQTGGTVTNHTTGFIFSNAHTAAYVLHGAMHLVRVGGNSWTEISSVGNSAATDTRYSAGSVSLSNVINGIRITTTNGTDTFDAGTIGVMYE